MVVFLKTFFVSLFSLGFLDFIWLGFVAKKFNNEQLAGLARMSEGQVTPLKLPAVLVYFVMALALTVYAAPKVDEGTIFDSLGGGALLGFILYAVYDLTNSAVLKDYPLPFALADMAWGTVLFAISNAVIFLARDWIR